MFLLFKKDLNHKFQMNWVKHQRLWRYFFEREIEYRLFFVSWERGDLCGGPVARGPRQHHGACVGAESWLRTEEGEHGVVGGWSSCAFVKCLSVPSGWHSGEGEDPVFPPFPPRAIDAVSRRPLVHPPPLTMGDKGKAAREQGVVMWCCFSGLRYDVWMFCMNCSSFLSGISPDTTFCNK